MLLKSAKINNFKSIGASNNIIYVEDTTTALIGKNESGKSNVLESIGLLNLWMPLPQSYIKLLTRGQTQEPTIELEFAFSYQDEKLFPLANGNTHIVYNSSQVEINGGYLI